jgi:glyoxylase-like metal-dependent hydrolase (beta-lactamase superfamily II)/rhodanese-related sulfurtransferase
MKVEQLYTQCLAEAAYLIVSKDEAAIIDPLREVQPYIDLADKYGAKIKYVFETHFHADFVSGHLDLARKTGAQIVYGPTAKPEFDAVVAADNDMFILGDVRIKLLHTPGHTMESSCYLLIDEFGKDQAVFTGDTLFLGDVGRPDLAVKSDLSREDLASHLFDSLRNKIMPLADHVIVYPGHGKGSACGKNMSDETKDTLGNQKQFNYALQQDMRRDEFIQAVTADLVAPPQYFPKNAVMNRKGYDSIDDILDRGVIGLDTTEFMKTADKEQALILDTRAKEAFAEAHIPGAIFIGIDDNFAPWVGALIKNLDQPILFIADEGREEEVVVRLSRVGYDHALGYLKGGIQAWMDAERPVVGVAQITPVALATQYDNSIALLDVRKESEYNSQHVKGAISFPLDFIYENLGELDKEQTYYVHCAGGYRSMIASSILMAHGFENVVNVQEGFKGLSQTALALTAYHEPVSLL